MPEKNSSPKLTEELENLRDQSSLVKKFVLILLPILFLLAAGFGIYQWQFKKETGQNSLYNGVSDGSLEDYYNFSQKQAETEATEVTFMAVGDIMLSRNVAGQMLKNQKDGFWPFRVLEEELHSTDFNFGNLESPFSGSDRYLFDSEFVFNAPTWSMPGLAQYNFKVLNLANNHIHNQGTAGIEYTKNLLTQNGLLGLGVGKTIDKAWEGQVYSTKGIRIGFIGANYANLDVGIDYEIAQIKQTDYLKKSIEDLKTRSDFVVVTMHAGEEYTREPNQSQINFARLAVDYGADLVIGAHPHWIQTTEVYKGKYIFYSLGNFVFDQMWSQDTKEGLMLKISLSKDGSCAPNPGVSSTGQQQVSCSDSLQGSPIPVSLKQIELIPVIIENYGRPRLATETEKGTILKKINMDTNIIKP